MTVEVRAVGFGRLRRELLRREANIKRPDPAWRDVGKYIAREVRKQFTTKGAHFGTPWKPLAPSTIAEKKRQGWPRQPLVRTGAMKREFTGSPLDIERYQGNVATFGASSDIAGYQHFGTKRNGRTHIPARVILKMTPQMRRDIKNILERHINGAT